MKPDNTQLNGEFTLSPDSPPANNSNPVENQKSSEPPTTGGVLSHFIQNPSTCIFPDKHVDEKVILILRSHMIVNMPWISLAIILLGAPLILLLLPNAATFIKLNMMTKIIMLATYYLLIFGYAFLNFILWYFQVTIITTQKIIDIDLNGILSRQVNEAPLDSIQDTEYTQKGFMASFWDYGDVYLQTDTKTQNLEVLKAPHPTKVVDIIGSLISTKGGHHEHE